MSKQKAQLAQAPMARTVAQPTQATMARTVAPRSIMVNVLYWNNLTSEEKEVLDKNGIMPLVIKDSGLMPYYVVKPITVKVAKGSYFVLEKTRLYGAFTSNQKQLCGFCNLDDVVALPTKLPTVDDQLYEWKQHHRMSTDAVLLARCYMLIFACFDVDVMDRVEKYLKIDNIGYAATSLFCDRPREKLVSQVDKVLGAFLHLLYDTPETAKVQPLVYLASDTSAILPSATSIAPFTIAVRLAKAECDDEFYHVCESSLVATNVIKAEDLHTLQVKDPDGDILYATFFNITGDSNEASISQAMDYSTISDLINNNK